VPQAARATNMPKAAYFVACVMVYPFGEVRLAGCVNSNVQDKRRHADPVASRPRALPSRRTAHPRRRAARSDPVIKHL
jgi:hypothetical protein